MAISHRRKISADVYDVVLTNADIEATYLVLPLPLPSDPQKITVDVMGLGAQSQYVDFIVTSGKIQWTAMGLETIVSTGDRLRITYHY